MNAIGSRASAGTAASGASIAVDELPASQSMRVAVVTETYPPEVNGVSLTLARIVDGLRQRRHDIQLVRPKQGAADGGADDGRFHEVLMRGVPIPLYPHLRMGFPAKPFLKRLWSVRRPDVVHIATEGPLGYSALKAAKALRLPVTSDFRTNFHAYSAHYGVAWMRKPVIAYLRGFHNATATTMVPTEPLRNDLAALGFRNLAVVARGVDTALFSPSRRDVALRRAWGVDDDALAVVCVGRLAPEKNLALALDAFAAIRDVSPGARLVFVGDGPSRADLAKRCPDAVFVGARRDADLAAHYASADLFLFPSLTETFGNVTLEAMASGLPVVAFDYAAAAQLVDAPDRGVTVPFGDDARFVAAARGLAADASRRATMRVAARAQAEAHGWDAVVALVESTLRRATLRGPVPGVIGVPAPSAV